MNAQKYVKKRKVAQVAGGSVELRIGDLLQCDDQFIVHQCNCVTKGSAGLAKLLFGVYPHADVYSRRAVGSYDVPGTINSSVDENPIPQRGVIALFGQYYPSLPTERMGDTASRRLIWFENGLAQISERDGVKQVAFPHGIGCGLAGGNWLYYEASIIDWAAAHPDIRVRIYRKKTE